MASAAERQRRSRAHRAGDHSLCVDPTRCDPAAPGSVTAGHVTPVTAEPVTGSAAEPVVEETVGPGGIETAVTAYVEALPYKDGDPRKILGEIAVQLARRVDESGALPAAVRELRVLLVQIGEVPNGPSGFVDEVRVRRAQRRIDAMLAETG